MLSVNTLYAISGGFLSLAVVSVILVGRGLYFQIKARRLLSKTYKDKKTVVDKFKANGGMHKWVNIAVQLPSGKVENTHVCEHTGYCPAIEGFVEVGRVKQILKDKEQAKEYEEYKRERLLDLSDEYCVGGIKELYDKMISIKKDFHIKKMNDFKAEIQAKVGKDVKIITNMEELDKVLGELNDKKS